MKTILIPLDFSPASNDAFRYGVAFAAEYQAKVVLLHVYSPGDFEPFVPVSMQTALMDEKEDLALEYFASIEQELSDELLKQVDLSFMIRVGSAADQILRVSEELSAELVVLGRKKGNPMAQQFWGNTATRIVQLISSPLLIVPQSAQYKGLKTIAYATNFESEDVQAIERVLKLANRHQATVHCVHIQKKQQEVPSFKQRVLKEAYQHEWTMHQLLFDTREHQSVVTGLNDYLDEKHIDMVVMLTHGRGVLSQIFHPSQTKQIALKSPVPILAYQMDNVMESSNKKKREVA